MQSKVLAELTKLHEDAVRSKSLFILSVQEVWEDFMEPKSSLQEKRRIVITFGVRHRFVLLGALAVLTAMLQTLQGILITSQFTAGKLQTQPQTRLDVVNLAIKHVEPASNVSAAVCFKTLFGDIDLGVVIQWAGK